MDGVLKISDAMNLINIMRSNGFNVRFNCYDNTIDIDNLDVVIRDKDNNDLTLFYDNSIAYLNVSEKIEDIADVFAYYIETSENTVFVDALNDPHVCSWIIDYDTYMTDINRGITCYDEMVDGLDSFIGTLIEPNGKYDSIVDIMNVLTCDEPYPCWDGTTRDLIARMFVIRDKYTKNH